MNKESSYKLEQYYNFDIIDLRYTDDDLQREWHLIKSSTKGYESSNSWNKIVKNFQFEEFYKIEIALWKENKMYKDLPLRSWLYLNRKKYINKGYGELTQEEIMRAFKITGIHIGNSFHSPMYIKQFCLDFNIKSIYDPCGGWGHRMLGACAAGANYSYNDINPNTYKNCIQILKYLNLPCYMYNNDAAAFTPDENYEAVFTCPPYHNTEWYSKYGAENYTYKQFINWWKLVVIHSCINKDSCKYFAFVINRTFEKDMKQVCIDLNLTFVEEHILGSSNMTSHLNSKSYKYEKLLIFKRND